MKKKKSLLDSFLFHEARKEVDRVSAKSGQGADGARTEYGQEADGTVPVKGRYDTGTIPVRGRYKDTMKDGQGADGASHNRIRLPPQQLLIYDWFVRNGFTGFFSNPQIAKETGIPLETIRKSMRKFKKIQLVFTEYDPGIRVFAYRINTEISVVRTDRIRTGSGQGADRVIPVSSLPLNSSSSSLKESTAPPDPSGKSDPDIETVLAAHPELGYWRQKGLTARQIGQWMKTAGCGSGLMIQYLCYCRYEMVDLDMEASKPVSNVFNWFFRILEKSGCYPEPKGYRSHEEKTIEAERALIAGQERQIGELKKLHRKKYEQERDIAFWEMMNSPDSDLYRQCLERLNGFARKKEGKGGKVFESAMRKAFDEVSEQ